MALIINFPVVLEEASNIKLFLLFLTSAVAQFFRSSKKYNMKYAFSSFDFHTILKPAEIVLEAFR